MNKCMVIVLIIILVILLINTYSCENYSGLDIQDNVVPCYEAINYNELDKSRDYNPDKVHYDNSNNEEQYNFSSENVPLSNSVLPMPSSM